MNNSVCGNKASMLRKSRIPVSNGSNDHFSSARVSTSPAPLRTSGSRIPVINTNCRVRALSSSPERKAKTPLSSPPGPGIREEKTNGKAERNTRPNISSQSKPAIPDGKQERQKRKAERNSRPNIGSLPQPAISDGKQERQERKTEPEVSPKRSLIRSCSFTAKACPSHEPAPTALESKQAAELDRLNLTISELKRKLLDSQNLASEQALRLAESKSAQRSKDDAMGQLKSELLTVKADYDHMLLRLEEADLGLKQATTKVNKHLEHTTYLKDELKEAHDTIAYLQRQPEGDLNKIRELQEKLEVAKAEVKIHCQAEAQLREDLDRMHVQLEDQQQELAMSSDIIQSMQQGEQDLRGDLEKRDRLITQVSNELAVRDEEFRNLFETLKFKQTKLRNQEHSIKLLEARNKRMRAKLEERNAAMQEKIGRLKHNLRDYSHVIIGNNGKPFFQEIPTPISQDIVCELGQSQEKQSQQHRKPSRRHN